MAASFRFPVRVLLIGPLLMLVFVLCVSEVEFESKAAVLAGTVELQR